MTTNKERAANIQHEVNPVLGWIRLAIRDGKPLTHSQMEAAASKLTTALKEAADIYKTS